MRFRVNDLHFMIYKRIKVRSLTVRCITISSKKVALERGQNSQAFVRTYANVDFVILYFIQSSLDSCHAQLHHHPHHHCDLVQLDLETRDQLICILFD